MYISKSEAKAIDKFVQKLSLGKQFEKEMLCGEYTGYMVYEGEFDKQALLEEVRGIADKVYSSTSHIYDVIIGSDVLELRFDKFDENRVTITYVMPYDVYKDTYETA